MKKFFLFFIFFFAYGNIFAMDSSSKKRSRNGNSRIIHSSKRVKITVIPSLHQIIANGDYEALENYIQKKYYLGFVSHKEKNILHKLLEAKKGKYEECLALLLKTFENNKKLPDFINAQDVNGNTPLHYAAADKNSLPLSLLLQYGASLNKTNKNKETPLHVASKYQNMLSIKKLLIAGADHSIEQRDGYNPLVLLMNHAISAKDFLRKYDDNLNEISIYTEQLSDYDFSISELENGFFDQSTQGSSDVDSLNFSSDESSLFDIDEELFEIHEPTQKKIENMRLQYQKIIICSKILLEYGAGIDIVKNYATFLNLFKSNATDLLSWLYYFKPALALDNISYRTKKLNGTGNLNVMQKKEKKHLDQEGSKIQHLLLRIINKDAKNMIIHGDISKFNRHGFKQYALQKYGVKNIIDLQRKREIGLSKFSELRPKNQHLNNNNI